MPPKHFGYRDIANDLAERIAAGEYPPGSRLPSYSQLASMYSCSVTTAQFAIRILHLRGLTYGLSGRGIFVAGEPST